MRSDERAMSHEDQVIKEQSGKFGKRAGTVMVLIWGDLLLRPRGQPVWRHTLEVAGVRRGHSTVSVTREGPNSKGLGTDSWHGLNKESRNGRRTAPRRTRSRVKPAMTCAVLSQPWG